MIEILSRYPFLIALLGALVIELSATLVRRAAQTLGGWTWVLAGILSDPRPGHPDVVIAVGEQPRYFGAAAGGAINLVIGPLLASGRWSLGVPRYPGSRPTAYLPWPPTRLVHQPPYRSRRRPMTLGWAMLAAGLALTTVRIEGWIWLGVWVLLAQPLLELEEWELRRRIPDAASYLDRTPRYFKLPRR